MTNKRLIYAVLTLLLFLIPTSACSLPPTVTAAPQGYASTLAAATWSAMQSPPKATNSPGPVYGTEGPGGPTATLPKAATATPRPSATYDPAAPTQAAGSDDLIGTAAAGLEVLITSVPTLLPYLTEALEDPVRMTAEGLEEAPQIGALAPDFSLVDAYSGETVRLSDLRGRPLLINFWATWCVFCEDEMPAIQKTYDKYKDQGFLVLAIDVKEGRSKVRNFGERLQLSFNLLLDGDGAVADRYLIYTFPTTYFVARDGVISNIIIGEMHKDEIDWFVSTIVE